MTTGMVVAPQPEAVEEGARALLRGGNAIDAAVTTALVQTAVDPQMCGIAGFGSMQVLMPGRGVHATIDFHARAPAAAREDMWAERITGEARDGFGFFLEDRVNEIGAQSVAVPGTLLALHEALGDWGTFEWADALEPAIAHARAGFVIRPHVHEFWTAPNGVGRLSTIEKLRFSADGRRIYFHPDGTLKGRGERVRNPDMARTLGRLAREGVQSFYGGALGEEVVAHLQALGGLITLEDLRAYRTRRPPPLESTYRGLRVASNQPPGGGVMLLEMLNALEHFELGELGHNTPEYIRVVAEAMKQATLDKDTRVGDPEFFEVPLDELLSRELAARTAAAIRRGEKVHVPRLDPVAESTHTTHVCTVDGAGNVVTLTHSLGMPSGVIPPGLGIMLNGCMAVFDPRPGRAGSVAPGKSRFSAMCPTVVLDGERPLLAIGAPGGTYITMGVLQGCLNRLDFGMSMLEAVSAPRFTANSDVIDVSNRIPRLVTDRLEAMGYPVARSHLSYAFAGVHAIALDGGEPEGGADPGRDGMALAVPSSPPGA